MRLPWRYLVVCLVICRPRLHHRRRTETAHPAVRPARRELSSRAIRLQKVAWRFASTERITLDGRLDEPCGHRARGDDFFQKLPSNGAPASERTEVRFVYDDDNLYIGVVCFDSEPDKSSSRNWRRFRFTARDLIHFIIDSIHDRRSGLRVVNPGGRTRDSQVSASGGAKQDWDGVWDVKARASDEGWIIEIGIPFKTLRFTNAASQEWGVQFARRIPRRNEESNWAPVPFRLRAENR